MMSDLPPVWPLEATDPPKVGDFWLDARMLAEPAGVAYAAHSDADGPVVLILLSDGAAADAAARDRFAGLVNELHIDTVVARGGQGQADGRLGVRFRGEEDDPVGPDDAPLAPWVALASDGTVAAGREASRILRAVQLSDLAHQGRAGGPDYLLPWLHRGWPGRSRMWPLPWPGRYDRVGWLSILASWLLMLLLAAVAVLMAILLFRGAPPPPPPPPVPTTFPPSSQSGSPPPTSSSASPPPSSSSASPPPSSGTGSPPPSSQSASPSPSGSTPASASPSQGSASPSPSRSAQPTPGPSGSAGVGSPTPNSKL